MDDKGAVRILENYSPVTMLGYGGFILSPSEVEISTRKKNVRDFKSPSAAPSFVSLCIYLFILEF
jgi:hypothetical protein